MTSVQDKKIPNAYRIVNAKMDYYNTLMMFQDIIEREGRLQNIHMINCAVYNIPREVNIYVKGNAEQVANIVMITRPDILLGVEVFDSTFEDMRFFQNKQDTITETKIKSLMII